MAGLVALRTVGRASPQAPSAVPLRRMCAPRRPPWLPFRLGRPVPVTLESDMSIPTIRRDRVGARLIVTVQVVLLVAALLGVAPVAALDRGLPTDNPPASVDTSTEPSTEPSTDPTAEPSPSADPEPSVRPTAPARPPGRGGGASAPPSEAPTTTTPPQVAPPGKSSGPATAPSGPSGSHDAGLLDDRAVSFEVGRNDPCHVFRGRPVRLASRRSPLKPG